MVFPARSRGAGVRPGRTSRVSAAFGPPGAPYSAKVQQPARTTEDFSGTSRDTTHICDLAKAQVTGRDLLIHTEEVSGSISASLTVGPSADPRLPAETRLRCCPRRSPCPPC